MIEPEVNRLIRESLTAQEEALKIALKSEGLRFNKKALKRIVRVKQVVTPIEPEKSGFASPVVQGCFILDQNKPTEKILFYFREATFNDPRFLVWFPEDQVEGLTETKAPGKTFKGKRSKK